MPNFTITSSISGKKDLSCDLELKQNALRHVGRKWALRKTRKFGMEDKNRNKDKGSRKKIS